MEQFTLAIKFTANSENYMHFKTALENLFKIVSQEEKFVESTIHQNVQKPEEFLVYEVWNDNFEHFVNVTLKKPHVLEWEDLLKDLQILREPTVYSAFAKFKKQ